MKELITTLSFFLSLFLPWILGSVWVLWLLRNSSRRNLCVVLGHGYLVGVLLTTLVIRGWGLSGIMLEFWGLVSILLSLILLGTLALRVQRTTFHSPSQSSTLTSWEIAVMSVLFALIAFRYWVLLQELILRPPFPWDAWMNWLPKSIVWFEYKELLPYVSKEEWLAGSDESLLYTAGASNAWKYPEVVPLMQLWGMLALGTSDYNLIYLPWLLVVLACGVALYGHLRLVGLPVTLATVAAYAFLNLPFINAHIALAGYADIWLMAAFGCAVFAASEYSAVGRKSYAILSLILAILCAQIKMPGFVMAGIVVVILVASYLRVSASLVVSLILSMLLCGIYIVIYGVEVTLPGVGQLVISDQKLVVPYLGEYELALHPVHHAIFEALFAMINWNILWYIFFLVLFVNAIKYRFEWPPSIGLQSIFLSLIFIFFVYACTDRFQFALDFSQINRALVYPTPVMIFYIFQSVHRWGKG